MAAAVVEPGGPARTAVLGRDPDGLFEIGSLTKGLTGLLLGDAIDRGELGLQTRLDEVLTELEGRPVGTVTLRELCTHTSGLSRMAWTPTMPLRLYGFAVLGTDPYRRTSSRTLLAAAGRQRLRHRGAAAYSNLGGALVGEVLARRTGVPYASLLAERVLEPIGMTRSAVAVRGRTVRWGRSEVGLPRAPWIMGAYAPAGGVVAPIDDLATLLTALLDGTAPGASALDALDPPGPSTAVGPAPRRLGLFWIVDTRADGREVVWHNGGTGGYSSMLVLDRHAGRGAVVVADSARTTDQERIATALLRGSDAPGG